MSYTHDAQVAGAHIGGQSKLIIKGMEKMKKKMKGGAACCEFYSSAAEKRRRRISPPLGTTHYIAHLLRRGMKQGKQRQWTRPELIDRTDLETVVFQFKLSRSYTHRKKRRKESRRTQKQLYIHTYTYHHLFCLLHSSCCCCCC